MRSPGPIIALLAGVVGHAAAAQSPAIMPIGGSTPLPAMMLKPPGDGPFPAVVIMHDCSGIGAGASGSALRWGNELSAQGYVVLIPDSFGPRGFPNGVCTTASREQRGVSGYDRAADAYGALAYLRTLPFIEGRHIGLMGASHGGFVVLATMVAPVAGDPLAAAKADGFTAALALYPSCSLPYGEFAPVRTMTRTGTVVSYAGSYKPLAPMLILSGERDDWTPAEPCRRLVESGRGGRYPLDIKVYPDAHHAFDNDSPVRYVAERNNPNASGGRGATTGGNPAAWADAKVQVAQFFATHLKPTR